MDKELKVEVIDGVVYLDGKALVDGAFVHGLVFIEGADFETLPERVTVFGQLHIIDCPNLTALPYRLVASEGLNVENCSNLEAIGLESYAGTYFTISGCKKIRSIPADMIVDGELGISDCGQFEPFHPGMNQAYQFSTEHFSLMEDSVSFPNPIPMAVMASCMGNTLRSAFTIPMIDSFPQMDRIVECFEEAFEGAYVARLAQASHSHPHLD